MVGFGGGSNIVNCYMDSHYNTSELQLIHMSPLLGNEEHKNQEKMCNNNYMSFLSNKHHEVAVCHFGTIGYLNTQEQATRCKESI